MNSGNQSDRRLTRRSLLAQSLALGIGSRWVLPAVAAASDPETRKSSLSRVRIGAIGMRYQGTVIAKKAAAYGDVIAVCDVDRNVLEKAKADFGGKVATYEDFHDLLARPDIDAVTIGAPDHWHAAMLTAACRAKKDVYCEKPLTLTIDEGKTIVRAVRETGRVVQTGSWQRSDHNFRLACELVRAGRIGKVRRVTVVLGKNPAGGPFATRRPPRELNWNLWQGQTPDVPYTPERCHYKFRWWYEYAGGQMTDWGAHHVDIAQWALGHQHSGPLEIDAKGTLPSIPNGFNVATSFQAVLRYGDGVEVLVKDEGRNGILFEGEAGRLFVNRGGVSGLPIEVLPANPFPPEMFRLYRQDNLSRPPRTGKLDAIVNHMGNFFDCIRSRQEPISDVASQHKSATACHLANISMRLGRALKWDPQRESFTGDAEANRHLRRDQRRGFEVGG